MTLPKTFNFQKGELLLIDKPFQWTSFDVVNKLRYSLKQVLKIKKIKVGHAGTLDPLATGLLILCTGKKTKQINELQGLTKEYTGSIFLGATRPSYDKETEINQTFDLARIANDQIYETAQNFLGKSEQIPPAHSAIKMGGEAAYVKARKGVDLKMKSREIEIYNFEIENIDLPLIYFKISCSKGTYIRSIAHDFGKALSIGAYLNELTRTKIGDYSLENAWKLTDLIDYVFINKELLLQYEGSQGN